MKDRKENNLRHRAEKLLAEKGGTATSEKEHLALIHELQVHQVELKMQNEELRRAQEEAEEQRHRYQDLYDFAPVGYLTLDALGKIKEANLAAASLLGCERGKLVGSPLFLFIAPESRGDYDPFLRRLLVGASGAQCEVRLGANAKRSGWLLLDGGTHPDGKQRDPGRLALSDITERKRFEQELVVAREAAEAANRVKGQFLANMSHELRTPMTGVIGMLDLALGEELTPTLRHYLEIAAGSSRSLLRILNDILDMAAIDAGKISLEEAPFILRESVAEVAALLAPKAGSKGLDLGLTLADDLPEVVFGDRVRLSQVLTNVVGNAVKFTERGRVKVEVTAGPASVGKREFTFTVTDTGIGIPADKKDLLFRMFSQADNAHTRKFGGAGLGLAISKEIVALMGGTISYASSNSGGSTFTFTVPLGVEEARSAPEPGTHLPAPVESSPRLLLVEDDPVPREVTVLMLRRANFTVDVAENGLRGVEMWEKGNYDLVLMDVQMPVMDGLQATRTIREKERLRGGHTPIVALTAHALQEDEETCFAAGMDAFVAKPIDFRSCIETIGTLLKREPQV